MKAQRYNLVRMTRFWNNLHEGRSRSNNLKLFVSKKSKQDSQHLVSSAIHWVIILCLLLHGNNKVHNELKSMIYKFKCNMLDRMVVID